MIKAVFDFGIGYSLPSYSTLRTKLVMNNKIMVENYVDKVNKSWSLSGCTLMSDIWIDMKGRSFINVVAYSPKRPVFLKSFERSSHRRNDSFLRDLLLFVIEEIGPKNVV